MTRLLLPLLLLLPLGACQNTEGSSATAGAELCACGEACSQDGCGCGDANCGPAAEGSSATGASAEEKSCSTAAVKSCCGPAPQACPTSVEG